MCGSVIWLIMPRFDIDDLTAWGLVNLSVRIATSDEISAVRGPIDGKIPSGALLMVANFRVFNNEALKRPIIDTLNSFCAREDRKLKVFAHIYHHPIENRRFE